MRIRTKSSVLTVVVLALGLVSGACAGKSVSFCSQAVSVAGVTNLFSRGLEDIPESQYGSLHDDLLFAKNATFESIKDETTATDATHLMVKLQRFIQIMDGLHWDFSAALLNNQAMVAASALGTSESLLQANAVESFVITHCGMPSTIAIDASADTLPSPVIPSPTATDPPANGINQDSEYIATGKTLGSIYGVTLTDTQALCVGSALNGIYDVSSSTSNVSQYVGQFQKAFSSCGVNIQIPLDS
jgi:hypothetical protein